MLATMRRNSKSALIYVFFGIIIVVFVFSFGPGSSGCKSGMFGAGSPNAAVVNGVAVTVAEFEQLYAQRFREYQSRAGGAFSEQLAESIGLSGQVLDGLIDRELLAQEAERQGLFVADGELLEALQRIPAFQVEGAFDTKRYRLLVERQLNSSAPRFENELRRLMLAQKLLGFLTASAKVSDDEVRAQFVREKEKFDLELVRFAPRLFKDQVEKPSEADLDGFLKESAARVEDFFKANKFRYEQPKRVAARRILVKLAEGAGEAEVEAARQKAEALRQKISQGADFAQVARESSEDEATKEKGGDLGLVEPGNADPAIQQAAFALAAGALSEPVRSSQGFDLVKAEQVIPEQKRPLKDVEREIASELLVEDRARAMAKTKAEESLAAAKEGKRLQDLWPASSKPEGTGAVVEAPPTRPEVETTGPFVASGDYVPRIGMDVGLARAIPALGEKRPVSDKVWEINGSFFVVALKAHEPADLKELEDKMDEYRDRARQKKANEVAEGYVKSLRERARIDKNEALLGGARRIGMVGG